MYLIFTIIFILFVSYLFKGGSRKDPIDSDEVWLKTTKTLDDFKVLMDNKLSTNQSERLQDCKIKASNDSNLKKENIELSTPEADAQQKLRDAVLSRGIKELVHFTRIENLPSIFNTGLQSRLQLQNVNKRLFINDTMRLDNRLNGISLSITHPNQRMFYKYRTESNSNKWCVVVLNPRILWELKCLYCKHNAADSRVRRLSDEFLSGESAFLSMFYDDGRDSQLPKNYTTDVQAEVLCLSDIPVEYIDRISVQEMGVVFADKSITNYVEVSVDKHYFNTREYNLS